MVLLTVTPAIAATLATLSPAARTQLMLPPPEAPAIAHDQLIRLAQSLRWPRELDQMSEEDSEKAGEVEENRKNHDTILDPGAAGPGAGAGALARLLRGSTLYRPLTKEPPPKTPSYLAERARLLAAAERREYASMVSSRADKWAAARPGFSIAGPPDQDGQSGTYHAYGSSSSSGANGATLMEADLNVGMDMDMDIPLSLPVNVLVSVVFTALAAYWALSHAIFRPPFGLLMPSAATSAAGWAGDPNTQPARVLLAVLAGLLVGVAEVVMYMAYARGVAAARVATKERDLGRREKRGNDRKRAVNRGDSSRSGVKGKDNNHGGKGAGSQKEKTKAD